MRLRHSWFEFIIDEKGQVLMEQIVENSTENLISG